MIAQIVAPPAAAATIYRCVRRAWRRFWVQDLIRFYGYCLLGAAGAVLLGGTMRFLAGKPVWDEWFFRVLLWAPLLVAVIDTVAREGFGNALERAALRLDRLAPTHDRFHTALSFVARGETARTSFEEMALLECARFVESFDLRRAIPLRFPWQAAWVPVPLIAYAMLVLYGTLGIGRPPRDPALAAAVDRRADTIEKIASHLQRHPAAGRPELARLTDEMKKSAERLRQGERHTDDERRKDALKEISSLEAMLRAMKQAAEAPKVTPAELAALAAALAANEPTREAAQSLQRGDLARAAGQLEQLLEQLRQQGNAPEALQQLAQSLQEQTSKLGEQEKNDLARQMEQAAQSAQSGQPQLSLQALQRLADLLRRAGANGQGGERAQRQAGAGPGGQPMTEKQLQDLISSLENMKDGLRPGDSGTDDKSLGQPKSGQGDRQHSLATVESFGQDASANPRPGNEPSGMPGSEHDNGHPDRLFGEKSADAAKSADAKRIEGLLGEGETLQELVAAGGGGPARATRQYKDLYDAMAPAAQETVEQENIPLGSRFYIRRYFENIRPKD